MTSQGQRFRRRALRRGYKVDEVDGFLDRVEATIAGEPIDSPVSAQEVHDVVFRVRFGGYDEWQVDLHLDRVERQLTEVGAAHDSGFAPGPDPRGGMMGPPERMALPPGVSGMGQGPGHGGPPPGHGGPPPGRGGPPPGRGGPPPGHGGPPPGHGPGPMAPAMPGPGGPPPGAYPEPEYDRYDEPTYGGYDPPEPPHPGLHEDRFASDMTSEMRLGDPGGPPGPNGPGMGPPPLPSRRGPAGPPPMADMPAGLGAAPPPPMDERPGPPGPGGPGFGPAPGGPGYGHPGPAADAPPEAQRLDQLRRTFQPRRFGSGYDRAQVDRLFEDVIAGVSGHGPMPVSDADLDPGRFDLVPGGYFEAEVEQALHEVRDILRRH